MCMTSPSMFLTSIIRGLRNPKQGNNVFLQPLINELHVLWDSGAYTYDLLVKEIFHMRATLMWTVNDFFAYGMLWGWSTVGCLACRYCMGYNKAFWLQHGGEFYWFDCHRQFLDANHPYWQNAMSFIKRKVETDPPSPSWTSRHVWEHVSKLPKVHEHGPIGMLPRFGAHHNWNKQSIFW